MIKREIIDLLEQYGYTNIEINGMGISCTNPIGQPRILVTKNISNANPILAERNIEIYGVTPTGLEHITFENIVDLKAVAKDITLEKDGKYTIIKFTDFFYQPTEEQIKIINETFND